MLSLNCLILGQASKKSLTENIGETYEDDSGVVIEFSKFTVSNFKEKLFHREEVKVIVQNTGKMDLWKVDGKKVYEEENNLKEFTKSDIKDKLRGEKMIPQFPLEDYFKAKETNIQDIHVFIVSTSTGKCLPIFYLSNKEIAVTKYRVWSDLLFFALKIGPSQQGISQVTTIFEEFLNSKHGEFLKKYIRKNDPLPSYKLRIHLKSIVPASFTGGRPTLLKYNLPRSNENHEPITHVSNVQSTIAEAKNNLLIFLGTSGYEKMRTWGLYFVTSRKGNGGSADIEKIQTYLEIKMTKDFEQNCKNIFGKLYDYDDDMFVALMWELNTCTPESVITFIDKTYKKIPNNNKTFIIILDETQVLKTVLKGKFKSRTDEQKRSLLFPIIQALREPAVTMVNYCVISCSSGLRLLSLENVLITGVLKPETEIFKFTEFGGWQDIAHVKNYVNNLVSLTDNKYNCLHKHFCGRFHPIITCVEEIIMGLLAQDVINVHWKVLTKQVYKGVDEEMLRISSVNVDLLHPALEGKKSLVACVDEPFAFTAANNDSSWKTLWQIYLPDEFERIFNGQSDIKNMPVFAEVTKKYNLPNFCKGSPKIVKSSDVTVP
uniref:Crinkler effector protein N-terminal domain-containing protein n=1 Tax=Rhizophagus irregularis (strain DAOM 181602 / DAOM 197198 / MUCL 43194) TaxID=747089 RepID=U9TB11_RHIID